MTTNLVRRYMRSRRFWTIVWCERTFVLGVGRIRDEVLPRRFLEITIMVHVPRWGWMWEFPHQCPRRVWERDLKRCDKDMIAHVIRGSGS